MHEVHRRQAEQDLADARQAAARLREHFTLANFQEFKRAVSRFLRRVAEERYATTHHWSDGRRYSVIAEVEANLAKLEEAFTGEYREEMLWVRRVSVIEGLLMDLYV